MKIIELEIDKLTPYEKNAKIHKTEDVATIVESIREFGMNAPIGVWGKDNTIVTGHGRWQACKALGMKKVPVIRLDHLSDEERRAYTLADNKTAEQSSWDLNLLNEEIAELDFDMEGFGFDIDLDLDLKHEIEQENTQNRK